MFSFPQIDPETTGRVMRVPVPFERYLSASFDQGFHDSAFNSVSRMTELTADKMDESSPMLDVETANSKYGVGDLKFEEPIREIAARTMSERKRAEMDRLFTLTNGFTGARLVPGMAAQILGGVMNPLDLGLMFLPIVGEERLAAKIAQTGGGALRQALARGLVTRELLEASRVPAPRLLEAFIQGAGGQAVFEIPVLMASAQDQAHYTAAMSAMNVLGGGVLGGALHLAGRALSSVSRGTRQAMMKDAINQFLRDEDVRVQDYVEIDEVAIREQVRFDIVAAKAEAMRQIGSDMSPIESFARAKLGMDGHIGEVDMHNLIKIAQDWIPLREQQGKDITVEKRLLDRVLGGERDATTLQNLASQFDLAFNPMERRFPQIYHLAGGANAKEIAAILPIKNAERRAQSAAVKAERSRQFEALVKQEYDRRVNEFVEQRRKEFDPTSKVFARRQVETARQQAEGRILSNEQIERYMHQERVVESEIAAVERDIESLTENLTGKPVEAAQARVVEKATPESIGLVPQKGKLGRQGWMRISAEGVSGSVHVEKDAITLVNLAADKPGQGAGGKFIDKLKQLADETGKPLKLVAEADTKELQPKLESFYEKHGLKRTTENNFEYQPVKREVSAKRELTPEQQALQRELDEALGQVPEPQEQAIMAAADCLLKNII